ncbi:MAG: M50 family metallopeptidase [Comamonadaceae bacterium]|nr:M50 family metallopeptidase [Comamonadaceae bacterium]
MNPRTRLILCAATIALLWQLPYGAQMLYPLTLLATFAHEMGHGLSALALGASFDEMLLHADGSGMAVWHGNPGRLVTALIAAGGLIGPSLAGVSLLLLSRAPRFARAALVLVAGLLLIAAALWTRNAFGIGFLLAWAVGLGLAARLLPDAAASFVLHLIAVTLCLSWLTDLDYMFSNQAVVGGVVHLSDSAVIAQALWLPYWFWGALVAVFSLVLVLLGIGFVSRTAPKGKATLPGYGTLPPI